MLPKIEAKALADAICRFMIVVSLAIWYSILFEVQNKEANLNSATGQLQMTKNYLVGCRCDEGFPQVLTDATEIAKELDIVQNIETEQVKKKKKEMAV